MTFMHLRSAAMLVALNVTSSKNGTADNTTLGVPNNIQRSWAQYTPWFSEEEYKSPPLGCEVVQVNLLHSHGARYPEQAAADAIQGSLEKFKHVEKFTDAKFDFIKSYKYSLGVSDLVPFGAMESFDSGKDHYLRYASLVKDDMLPFVRASSRDRVVDSANNWTAGFAQANHNKYKPELSVILSEKGNDTLDDKMCPEAGNSKNETSTWADTFSKTMATDLNYVAQGAKLNGSDMINFMSLCAFDTVAHRKASPWCGIFDENQWSDYEYYGDLSTYYLTGYGEKLGRVQGVGYVNELIARLTGQPTQDKTQTNFTLDDSYTTFPIDRTFYADFTHDNQMIAIYSALGLFKQPKDLDPKKADSTRTWITSRMVPFSARMVTEKLTCKAGVNPNANGTNSLIGNVNGTSLNATSSNGDEYVRVLVNDVVQKLEFCDGDADGLCKLSKFVESQAYARENGKGDWKLCSKKPKDVKNGTLVDGF